MDAEEWIALFDRATAAGVGEADVRAALDEVRAARTEGTPGDGRDGDGARPPDRPDGPTDTAGATVDDGAGAAGRTEPSRTPVADGPDPARVVADADVLAADLLAGGPARDALEAVWRHEWVTLVASDRLLADAAAVAERLADGALADEWRATVDGWRHRVEHAPGDHPGLASAAAGGAAHLLSFDERLGSAATGATLRKYVDTSVKHPRAFARLFDPERLHPVVVGGPYPGPDRPARGRE